MTGYFRRPVSVPAMSGAPLRAFVAALETPGVGPALLTKILKDSGFEDFRATPTHGSPVQLPLEPREPGPAPESPEALAAQALAPAPGLETVAAFHDAYRGGSVDPVHVVRTLHAHLERMESGARPLGLFIARDEAQVVAAAEDSARRLRAGTARSVLEGVPVLLKDELDLEGFPTTLGTSFLTQVATADSTVAARLKRAGAVILGKGNMNEIGINPIGLNPHHGACRNPFDPSRITGGSSSASAAAVAAGLCPISIGADGGGSVRIPAALCGVVGLKATWGRISEAGVPPLCWNPGHVGPLGLTVSDVAATYAAIAGRDEADPATWRQPAPHLRELGNGDLRGLTLGVCWPAFEDAEPDVVKNAKAALRALTDAGAVVKDVPPPDLNTVLWSHAIIILSEMATAMLPHTQGGGGKRLGLDSRTNLAIGRHFRSTDLVHAMRHRHQLTRELLATFAGVDAIVSPTTACVAPPIPEHALPEGESNLPVVDALMRFIRVGNLTGFPALALPSGFDARGLPTSVHLLGRPWEEHLLLRLGKVIEARVERRAPQVHVRALPT
ncbi:MAG: amidase [Myxococcaceae bacterium]|nr:amidase [Myxococcaceae bacterium]